MVDALTCKVMPYAWGSRTAIAELQGRSGPSSAPEAELWMGAHPVAPALVVRQGSMRSLADVVAEDPHRELGADVAARFGHHLPFLMKVLAAAEPLSLQAHPTRAQARAGFDDEEKRGIPRDAPHRNYRDPSHKPELLCALTPFDALCGFRQASETLRLFERLGVTELRDVLAPLRDAPDADGLSRTFRALMSIPEEARARTVEATVEACLAHQEWDFARERAWAVRIAALYPGDIGVVSSLLLNLVHLEPGDAIYLDAGNLHAYLDGVGVEIMASSDNVLRGGLTKKYVDVPELMRVLDFSDGPIAPLRARPLDGIENVFDTPAREFRLSVLDVPSGTSVSRDVFGPEILFCAEGTLNVSVPHESRSAELSKGTSVFVSASTSRYALTGKGTLYRATVNHR